MNRRAVFTLALVAPLAVAAPALAAGGKERKKSGGLAFQQMPAATASVRRADGRRGVMTVELGVDAPDTKVRERVAALQPRLRDAYNSALGRFAAGLRPGLAPDADFLSRELQAATDRIMGAKGAKLLLGTVLINA